MGVVGGSLQVQAVDCTGPSCGGGGHSIGNEFYNSYLTRRDMMKDPKVKRLLNTKVEAEIKKIESWIPYIGQRMRVYLTEKQWFLVDRKIPETKEGIVLDADQLAFQNNDQVYVDEKRYHSLKTEQDKVDFLVHELMRGFQIESEGKKSGVTKIMVDIAQGNIKDGVQFRDRLRRFGLHKIKLHLMVTAKEVRLASENLAKAKEKIIELCQRYTKKDFDGSSAPGREGIFSVVKELYPNGSYFDWAFFTSDTEYGEYLQTLDMNDAKPYHSIFMWYGHSASSQNLCKRLGAPIRDDEVISVPAAINDSKQGKRSPKETKQAPERTSDSIFDAQ